MPYDAQPEASMHRPAASAAPAASASVGKMQRARAWRARGESAVCDEQLRWEHGTIMRASRYPSYYRYNFVRVDDDPGLGAADLANVADEALHGLEHRRLEFDSAAAGEAVREQLHAAGWRSMRTILMRHEPAGAAPAEPHGALEEVPYDEVRSLRASWHEEDFGVAASAQLYAAAKEVALRRGARVFAARGDAGAPLGFAQLESLDGGAEIAEVYVHPEHRGRGLGTAITSAARDAAGEVEDLWIAADDEGRPKQLYARLGFRPVWATMEFLLLP